MLNALTVLLVLYLVYRGDRALGDFEPYLRDVENMRGTIARRGNDILEKTITVAQEMIRNAVYTSQKNIKHSESLQDEMENAVKSGVEQNLSETRQVFQKVTQDIISAHQKQFSVVSQDIEAAGSQSHEQIMEATKQRIDQLSQGVARELSAVRNAAQEQMNKELTASQESIRVYREQKLKELDGKVYQVLSEVAKKTIGHAIDLSTHEKLVMEALEKAKKEKLI
ncbi:MAG: hypothetical protein A2Z11_00640 [Candidatus Woykebacteria bacterium RBG_16_43_9]|uniref:Uncharacterized protein n=1 Tax=Candidatus Woykebacteria bacterium RBG_16_43_9 TaxID=1802596 RepID=A0A1G1WCE0_9BACT|nr:MAG: hypothetical protein A2Z11_00640 [Candidatus Woykebacteria bacterium RBG_16_43_9]